MIFSNEEINKLFYCSKMAEILNEYYYEITKNLKTSNGQIVKIKYTSIFEKLKNIIIRIDNFLKKLLGFDLSHEEVVIAKNYFNGFIFSSYYKVGQGGSNLDVRDFVWGFYNFISDFFEKNNLLKDNKNSDLYIEIDQILTELHNINQSSGITNFEKKDNLYDRVVLLEDDLKKLTKEVKLNSTQIKETVDGFLLTQEEDFNKKIYDLIEDLKSSLVNINNTYENEIKGKVESLGNAVKKTDKDFQSTYDDYLLLKKMVQAKGEQEVTNHYKNKASWERFTYWFMTTLTFIIIGGAICLATLSLNDYKTKTSINIDEWSQKLKNQPIEKIEKIYELQQKNALIYLILRLVISIFLFSSIIYTSRIAYRAYIHMRHSENMRLKLATLRPFINHLDSNDKKQIHKDLIPDYFGKDAGLVDTANEKFKDLPANVSAVAMKAIEQISGSGSNSSTEKNGKKSEGGTE